MVTSVKDKVLGALSEANSTVIGEWVTADQVTMFYGGPITAKNVQKNLDELIAENKVVTTWVKGRKWYKTADRSKISSWLI